MRAKHPFRSSTALTGSQSSHLITITTLSLSLSLLCTICTKGQLWLRVGRAERDLRQRTRDRSLRQRGLYHQVEFPTRTAIKTAETHKITDHTAFSATKCHPQV